MDMSRSGLESAELWQKVERGTADAHEKAEAAWIAGEEKDRGRIPQLFKLIGDEDSEVRYYALQSLVLDLQQTDSELENVCWKLLSEDPDDSVRSMAATCLGKVHFASLHREAFRRMLSELKDPKQPGRAKAAMYSALFKIAARQPHEWPGLSGPRKAFKDSDIDWEKVAQLEDEVCGPDT
jgi:HEAT repeat protein